MSVGMRKRARNVVLSVTGFFFEKLRELIHHKALFFLFIVERKKFVSLGIDNHDFFR